MEMLQNGSEGTKPELRSARNQDHVSLGSYASEPSEDSERVLNFPDDYTFHA